MMKKIVLTFLFLSMFITNAKSNDVLNKDIAETTVEEAYNLITKNMKSHDELYRGYEFVGFSRGAIQAYRHHTTTTQQFDCLNKTPLDVDDVLFGRYKDGKISGNNIYIDEIINLLDECMVNKN